MNNYIVLSVTTAIVLSVIFDSISIAEELPNSNSNDSLLLSVIETPSTFLHNPEAINDRVFEAITTIKRAELKKILSSDDREYLCDEAGTSAKELTFKEEIEAQKKTNKKLRIWTQGEISFFLECDDGRAPLDKAIQGIVVGDYQFTENSKNILDEAAAYLETKNTRGWTPLSWIEDEIATAIKAGASTTKYKILQAELQLRIAKQRDRIKNDLAKK